MYDLRCSLLFTQIELEVSVRTRTDAAASQSYRSAFALEPLFAAPNGCLVAAVELKDSSRPVWASDVHKRYSQFVSVNLFTTLTTRTHACYGYDINWKLFVFTQDI